MSEFTWVPDRNFSKNTKPRVLEAKFDDGYSQRVASTLNNLQQEWKLVFKNRDITEINAILGFLESKYGVNAFTWTPPGGVQEVKVICQNWTEKYVTDTVGTLTAVFRRVYE